MLSAFLLLAAVVASTTNAMCTRPPIPWDLDIIGLVESAETRELHLHGRYALDPALDQNRTHNMTLSVNTPQ